MYSYSLYFSHCTREDKLKYICIRLCLQTQCQLNIENLLGDIFLRYHQEVTEHVCKTRELWKKWFALLDVQFFMLCISLFDLFFWPLCCLFFFDLLILITPLVSSNSGSCYSIFSFFMCMFCRSLFVLFLLAIVLSVLLRFGIFKLFISNTKKKIIRTLKVKKINDIRV